MSFAVGFVAGSVFWLGALGLAIGLAILDGADTREDSEN